MADYQTPSLTGTDAETEERTAKYLHNKVHTLLDRAGVDVNGNLYDRVALVLIQRDNLGQMILRIGRILDDAGVEHGDSLADRVETLAERERTKGEDILPRVGLAVPEVEGMDEHWLKIALTNWWIDLAHEEVDRVVPKAVEYGSTDLMEVGRQLANVMGWDGLGHEEHTELGIYFYLLGKLARWTDAVRERRRPSDDTLHDIGVYVRMAQRTRAVGGWPVGDREE